MRRYAALALAGGLVLSACSSSPDETSPTASPTGDIEMIEVVQSDTLAPDILFVEGLDYPEEQTRVLWDGDGEPLQAGQPLLLDIYAESLIDGTVITNTFDGTPQSFLLAPEIVGEAMADALQDMREGGRAVVVTPPGEGSDENEPVALVVDVLPVRAHGEPVGAIDGMPIVTTLETGEPQVTLLPGRDPVVDLQVATLIKGPGQQVRPHSRVLANYTIAYYDDSPANEDEGTEAGADWKAGDVFDSSWPSERSPLVIDMSEGSPVPGLQQGLIDQTEGSQVMMVVPPTLGYPERGTMVFVVDILDVWTPED